MVLSRPSVPFAYIRGGTSKALFFHEKDIPAPGPKRDVFLRRVMGSPDPLQIDGMGGSHIVTSKIAIIRPSEREEADVDYTFAQVGIGNDYIGYTGNCGNISAGVGPFAIDEGLVKQKRPGVSPDPGDVQTQQVRIYNTGTKKVLISHVPTDPETGLFLESGKFAIDGVPGTAAPILMDYSNVRRHQFPVFLFHARLVNECKNELQVIGAALNKGVIPTQHVTVECEIRGKRISYTICDVANIIAFARAQDLGIVGNEPPSTLDKDTALIARIKEVRGKAAQAVGMCKDWQLVDEQSPMLPMVALVSPATSPECDVQSRLFLDNKCHTSMAGTGAICTAACSRITGSVVNAVMAKVNLEEKSTFRIQHPLGMMPIVVETSPSQDQGSTPTFESLSFIRTARRIMDGRLYVPSDVLDCV